MFPNQPATPLHATFYLSPLLQFVVGWYYSADISNIFLC